MKRASTLVLVVAAVLLAGCDRAPTSPTAVAPSTATALTGRSIATDAAPATVPPAGASRPSSTPVTPGTAVSGTATPAGRFLVRRGTELWLVSVVDPSLNRRLFSSSGDWFFGGVARRPDGPEVVIAEDRDVEKVGGGRRVGSRMVSRIRLADGLVTPLFRYGPYGPDFSSSESDDGVEGGAFGYWGGRVRVAPDGSRIAYAYGGGLYVRERDSNTERRLLSPRADSAPCSGDCFTPGGLSWSPDGQFLIAMGVNYEPIQTYRFDPEADEAKGGVRLPVCVFDPVWLWSAILGNDGDCYSQPGPRFFWYDVATGTTNDLRAPAGYKDGFAQASTVSVNNEYAVTWAPCLAVCGQVANDWYGLADIVALYRADGTIYASVGTGARARHWTADGSGVVLDLPSTPKRFLFIDRAGLMWNLPLDATTLFVVLD